MLWYTRIVKSRLTNNCAFSQEGWRPSKSALLSQIPAFYQALPFQKPAQTGLVRLYLTPPTMSSTCTSAVKPSTYTNGKKPSTNTNGVKPNKANGLIMRLPADVLRHAKQFVTAHNQKGLGVILSDDNGDHHKLKFGGLVAAKMIIHQICKVA